MPNLSTQLELDFLAPPQSASLFSFATGDEIQLPLPLLEKIVERAEDFRRPECWKEDILTLHRAWASVLQPFNGALDNYHEVVRLRYRLMAVVNRSGALKDEITPKSEHPARIIHKLKKELAAA